MSGVGSEVRMEEDQRAERAAVGKREVRWSTRRKEGVVMRLLRGESLDLLARETGRPAGRIVSWREEFLAAGREGLKARRAPVEDVALREAQRKVGELSMEVDILGAAAGEAGPPSVAEALEVSEELPAPLATVCRVARVSRSAACEQRRRRGASEPARRRPKPLGAMTDTELLGEIRRVLRDSPFVGEGHRKVWARLRRRGVPTSKRVLRPRARPACSPPPPGSGSGLRASTTGRSPSRRRTRCGRPTPPRDGRPRAARLSSPSSTTPPVRRGPNASLRMDRFAVADLLREVTTERFGSVERAVCSGLALCYDGGPCFRSEHYQAEIDHLGIARSPAYHYEPETNGCVERFIQTLKEQVLWVERFETHEQLRAAVRAFALAYNQSWLLERHDYRTPIEARQHLLLRQAALA